MAKEVKVDTKKDVMEMIAKHPEKKWYIVQTAAKSEDAAKRNILELLKVKGVEDDVAMVLISERKMVELKNGEKKVSKRKNYPGWIFVLANMNEKVMVSVREAGKVIKFVESTDGKFPNPMKTKDINDVLNQLDVDAEVAPTHKIEFATDEEVTIINGPFNSFNGAVKRVNYEKEEIEVSILIFGRETPVNIGFKDVVRAV